MLAANHKRILRNTGMLYMRMLLVMAVTLYTSRVVLAVLGVEDFGIYHVVAGFVALLGFMQGAMTTATQRYFAFDLGESGGKDLNRIFNTSLLIHLLLALVIAAVAETAGYWFVTTQLTIPDERMAAALWAYHLAIASFAVSVITVPFTAMLMAHERMGIFALIGMLDVLLKLAAVILLQFLASDKLIAYAGLLLLVSLTTLTLYITVNKLLFRQIKLRWQWHRQQFRSMFSFTVWSTWGNLAAALSNQGSNVLLNIFFGPAVNAGRSISSQANGAISNFVVNVQAAINPQIIKLYASGKNEQMHRLVFYAAKYNFFILFTLSLPVLINTDALLSLWLVEVPPYAGIFLQLAIGASLVDVFSKPLMTAAQATGKIKSYQTIVGGILLLNIPLAYLALKLWPEPEVVAVTLMVLNGAALIARLIILKKITGLKVPSFLNIVILPSILVLISTGVFLSLVDLSGQVTFIRLVVDSMLAVTWCVVVIAMLGLSKQERRYIVNLVKDKVMKNSQ